MQSRILIAGAGIGGLTTALCLAKSGHQVTIFERRDRLEEDGAGIQISPNASRVLVTLGLEPSLASVAVAARNLIVRRLSDAHSIARMALNDLTQRYKSPYWLLRRADLQSALLAAVNATPGINVDYGRTVDTVQQRPGGLAVSSTTANDTARTEETFDLLVGADGLWSSIADQVDVQGGKPRFTGYEAWRALLPAENIPPALHGPDVALWLGSGTHIVTYPVASGAFLNIVLVREGASAETGWTRAGNASALSSLLTHAAPDLRRLLEQVTAWQIWSLFDAPVRPMASNRIALVGDAAHPVLPFLAQGAALAIEDAAALATRLTHTVLADETALTRNLLRYDRERRPRAMNVQRAARSNGKTYHLGWPASLVRDQAMSLLGGSNLLRRYDWLYGWNHQQL